MSMIEFGFNLSVYWSLVSGSLVSGSLVAGSLGMGSLDLFAYVP